MRGDAHTKSAGFRNHLQVWTRRYQNKEEQEEEGDETEGKLA